MTNNEEALNELIEQAMSEEKAIALKEEEMALQSAQFADYLKQKKILDDKLDVLWQMAKDFMIENDIFEHETEAVKLKLTPSGKYTADDINAIPDSFCKITRTLDNKKVKAYLELNEELPEGIKSTGYVLRKTIK